jgi:superfamily II DNA or RNA helicase
MALTLHVHWFGENLYLWGERGNPAGRLAGPEELRDAVGELSADALLASVAGETTQTLWLPCDEQGPILSSIAVAASGSRDTALLVGELRAVNAPALMFSPVQAMDWLTSLPAELPPGCGDSVRFWRTLAHFVIDLLARRQFTPHMDDADEGYVARWRALVQDRDELDWLERFVTAMPPSCRAVVDPENHDAADPARWVEKFLAATADALVRRSVADDHFFRQPAERLANVTAPADTRPPETRWLAALLGEDARVSGSDDENTLLAHVVQAWVGQIEPSAAAAAMKLVFRLEEPEDDSPEPTEATTTVIADDIVAPEGKWRLDLVLESETGDGEIVDAADLWVDGAASVLLGRGIKNRQARLMGELARAAQIFPTLLPLTQQTGPTGIELETPDAYAFIRQWSQQLRDQGFGVILPMWADRNGSELGLRLNVRPMQDFPADGEDEESFLVRQAAAARAGQPMELPSGHFGLDALLQFDWQIAVGNLRLSPTEFQSLAARNVPLVKLRGQWVQIDLEAARLAAAFLEKQKDQTLTLAEALRTAYGASRSETGLPVLGLGGTSWIEELLEQMPGAKLEEHAQPKAFNGTLRPYQLRGLQWMAFLDRLGIGACLADDMGRGKTIQLIALLLLEREKLEAIAVASNAPVKRLGPTLLFAPTSVVGNWVRELERFANKSLRVLVHHGPERLTGEVFAREAAAADVVITSYALAHRDKDDLRQVSWHRLALDEAQKIKNPSAASTIAIRALTAGRRVAMTGTPIENHLSELWSIMEILNPGLLGPAGDFREKFSVPIEKLGDRDRSEQLRKLIRPFIMRRLKTDPDIAGDLPEKMEAKIFCNLTPEQAAQYERVVGQSLNQIDSATGIRRRGLILSVLTRLKQICDHPSLVLKDDGPIDGRSGKCERLVEMLEELLDEGDAALVFTQFREMGHLLERTITKRLNVKAQFLHGGTPAKDRDTMIEKFQDPANGIKVFILSLRAGGLGLNLTAANHVFHYDRWWNPAVESQATDRAHRVGQTRRVQVHKFVCIGTMEERIDRLLTEKLALADKIIGSGDEWLTSMSTDQLREYLALSKEAVGEF